MQNLVILAGNVGASPESRTTTGGTKITNFSLATSRPKRDSNGKILKDDNNRRSEEHTSELQSLMRISYAVFCLKKKKHSVIINQHNQENVNHVNAGNIHN